jgi:hypothetical protein
LGDAQRYELSGTGIVLFLFDPFNNPAGLEQVLENVQKWLDSGDHGL